MAFFEAGDMSQNQILRRFMTRAAGRPIKASKILIPEKIIKLKTKDKRNKLAARGRAKGKIVKFKKRMDLRVARKACDKVLKAMKTKESFLRLSCYPNSTLSISQIKGILQDWERDGWVADVVVIDYADILAPDFRMKESRDTINEMWKQMRALSQSFHCLVLTASQAAATGYKVRSLDLSHFSDDKRKRGHITGLFALNETDDEKTNNIMRIQWLAERERSFKKEVTIAGCRAIANPAMISRFI